MRPKLSIVIPIHEMKGGAEFLWRNINSLMEQTFKDFEIIITREGKMAENTNAGIKRARGKIIKILYLDDYLAHKNVLQDIVDAFDIFEGQWLIQATDNNEHPRYTENIETGNNKLGSPSALAFINRFETNLLFDEKMSWLLDCDFYKRYYEKHGLPIILDKEPGVILGVGDHQVTHLLTIEEKQLEHDYMIKKYE